MSELQPQPDGQYPGLLPLFCAATQLYTREGFAWAVFDVNAVLTIACVGLLSIGSQPQDVAAATVVVGLETLIESWPIIRG